jgi:phosphoribosylaminoimidazole carboxylase (NCAIR synthetase)
MSHQCVLVLGGNQFQRERALIGIEKATNATVVTVALNAPFHENKFPAKVICSNENMPDVLLKDVQNFLQKTKMSLIGIIPLNDFVLNSGLAIAQNYGLPYNSAETIKNCRYKTRLKKILASANLPIVKSHEILCLKDAESMAKKLGYPLVIKPVNFGGSGGVKKVSNLEELRLAYDEAIRHLSQYAKKYDSESNILVLESYIHREKEVSIEVLNTPTNQYLVGITDKYLSDEPYFSEVGHFVPSSLMFDEEKKDFLFDIARKACKTLQINYGLAHVEIKINKDGSDPIIIEVGSRPAGDGILDLYEKSTRYNFYKAHCESYLGNLSVDSLPTYFECSSALAYLHPMEGVIESINNQIPSDILQNVDIIRNSAYVGQEISCAQNWSTRYGYVEFTLMNDCVTDFDLISTIKTISNSVFKVRQRHEIC